MIKNKINGRLKFVQSHRALMDATVDWLVEVWLLNVQWQTFQTYSGKNCMLLL